MLFTKMETFSRVMQGNFFINARYLRPKQEKREEQENLQLADMAQLLFFLVITLLFVVVTLGNPFQVVHTPFSEGKLN